MPVVEDDDGYSQSLTKAGLANMAPKAPECDIASVDGLSVVGDFDPLTGDAYKGPTEQAEHVPRNRNKTLRISAPIIPLPSLSLSRSQLSFP